MIVMSLECQRFLQFKKLYVKTCEGQDYKNVCLQALYEIFISNGPGEMAHSVEPLCEHENPSPASSTLLKARLGSRCLWSLPEGRRDTWLPGAHWPDTSTQSLSFRVSERLCLKTWWESDWGGHQSLTSDLHTHEHPPVRRIAKHSY